MNTTRLKVLAALALPTLFAGCAMEVPGDDVGAAEEELTMMAFPVTTVVMQPRGGVSVPAGCDRNRMVGQPLLSRTCPTPSNGWVDTNFLTDPYGTPIRDRNGDRFCLYEFRGSRYTQIGLPTDRGSDDIEFRTPSDWLEADCRAVVALGDTDDALETMAQGHQDAFLEHIAALDSLPQIPTWSSYEGYPRTTEVAILDSSTSSGPGDVEPRSGSSLHGRAVGLAIRNVVCPEGREGACPLDVTNYEVLDIDSSGGGSYGNVSKLATAIHRASDAAEGNLVINLSLGWHPDFALRNPDSETPAFKTQTLAVEAALNWARCHGALVIAAAGNSDDGPDVDSTSLLSDPMYPARLDQRRGWTCFGRRAEVEEPVVYAVGAVGPGDLDVANTRERAVAALVGPGHAVTFDNSEGNIDGDFRNIPVGTGSSFGAASASAVAALVWAYLPSLTPPQVMDIVRATAVDLGRRPDFRDRNDTGNVRRVSACNAVRRAYEEVCESNWYYRNYGWYFCRDVVDCSTPEAGTPEGPTGTNFDAMLDLATPRNIFFRPALGGDCGPGRYLGTDTQDYCPDLHFDNGMANPAGVSTQPGDDLCGACAVGVGSTGTTVVIGLDPSYTGSLTSPVLNYGNTSYGLGSTLSYASGGSMVSFKLPGVYYSAPASLSYMVSTTQSITSVLPVYSF